MISSAIHRVAFTANGVTTEFAVPFVFFNNSDLRVYRVDLDGVIELLTIGSDYTVSGAGNPSGGTVTITPATTNGYGIVVVRRPAFTQVTDYVNNSAFDAEAHEKQMDAIVMQAQCLNDPDENIGLYPLKFPPTDASPPALPHHLLRAGKVFYFDETTGEPEMLSIEDLASLIAPYL